MSDEYERADELAEKILKYVDEYSEIPLRLNRREIISWIEDYRDAEYEIPCKCNDFQRWYTASEIYFNLIYRRWEITANWPIWYCPFCGNKLTPPPAEE